jgi:hypothetical protein
MNTPNPEQNNTEKNKKKKRLIVYALLIIILILLAFLLGRCSGDHFDPTPTRPTINQNVPTIDPDAGEYIEPTKKPGEAGGIAIPGWGRITIPANTTDNIVVDFYNPEENANKYYLTFELRLPADNEQGYEVLYASGLIDPGLHIQSISLNRALEPGEYDAIIHVQPYRYDTKAKTNNADLKT